MWLLFPESSPDGDPSGRTSRVLGEKPVVRNVQTVVPVHSKFAHICELKLNGQQRVYGDVGGDNTGRAFSCI